MTEISAFETTFQQSNEAERAALKGELVGSVIDASEAFGRPDNYNFGAFRLDVASRVLSRGGVPITLTPTVTDLLFYFVTHPERLVSKDELLDAIWPGRIVEESNLRQTVFTLRRALGDDGGKLIVTIPGRGYRFAVTPRIEARRASEDVGPIASMHVTEPDPAPRRWTFRAISAGAAVAVGLGAVAMLWHPWTASRRAHEAVVLADFVNLTGDPVFDRTIGEVLRIDLNQSPYLTLVSDQQAQDTLDQMGRARSAALTPTLAREICARTNSDEVIGGKIAAVGSRYMITLDATDCSGQTTIAADKVEIGGKEAVMGALDEMVARMRGKLGEPVQSVDRFNVPLVPAKTASLEAVKAYSEGIWLDDHGQPDTAIAPLRRAAAIDPSFAAAHLTLAGIYNNLLMPDRADAEVVLAHALEDRLNERQRINAEVYYSKIHSGDVDAMLRALQIGTEIYPTDRDYWINLANTKLDLGDYAAAAAAARLATRLEPPSELAYLVLAAADLALGNQDGAREASAGAVRTGVAGAMTHAEILEQAMLRGDEVGVRQQMDWLATQPDNTVVLTIEGRLAYRQGRIAQGDVLYQRIAKLTGGPTSSDPNLGFRARLFDDLGLAGRGRALLATAAGLDDNQDYIVALAQMGDASRAGALLDRQIRKMPQNTLLRVDFAPRVRAMLALRRGDSDAALAALQPALPYQARGFDVPFLLGKILIARRDYVGAASAFRTIVDHPGWYPESPYYSLAEFWLARTLALQGKGPEAHAAYGRIIATWRDADPGFPLLQRARAEDRTAPA